MGNLYINMTKEQLIIRQSELLQKKREVGFDVERLNTKQMVIKILVNSCYGYMGNKQAPIGDDDIASSVTLTGQAVIKHAGKLLQDYLREYYNITNATVLDESWVYSDTDSCYFSLGCIQDKVPIMKDGDINPEFYKTVDSLNDYLNAGIKVWAEKFLRTENSRFIFKREYISDIGVFLQKKRYVLHILDNKGIKTSKFKYTGVEVVRTTMPDSIKPYAKKIIETMFTTKSLKNTNDILNETYEKFKSLSPEEIGFVMGVRGYEKYSSKCKEFTTAKGMPLHVKSAYYHNHLMNNVLKTNKSEDIVSGDKVRYVYLEKPNKYGIESVGFKYEYPDEFKSIFKIDYDKMFDKILFESIRRFYEAVSWQIRKPSENVKTDLFELFSL